MLKTPGSIRKRGNTYQVQVFAGRTAEGKRIVRSATYATLREAQQNSTLLVQEAQRVKSFNVSDATVAELVQAMVDASTCRPTTVRTHRWAITKLGTFGTLKARKATKADAEALMATLATSGLGPASIGRIHATVRRAFTWGITTGAVQRNPVKGIPVPVALQKTDAPTKEQIKDFLAYLAEHRPELVAVATFIALTGCRAGEVCALRWSSVKIVGDNATVRIEASAGKGADNRLTTGPTKTGQGRTLNYDASLLPEQGSSAYVFPNSLGRLQSPDGLRQAFKAVWDVILPERTFAPVHGLRHFVTTLLISDPNISSGTIMRRLGWNSLRMLSRYAHLEDGADRAALYAIKQALATQDK